MTIDHLFRQLEVLIDGVDQLAADFNRATDDGIPDNKLPETFMRLRDGHDRLDKARKKVYHIKDRMDKFLVPELLNRIGPEHDFSVIVPSAERKLYLNPKVSCSMLDKEKAMAWLRNEGDGDMIQPTVNASALAAYAKARVEEQGMDMPDELFKMTTYNTTGIVKVKIK